MRARQRRLPVRARGRQWPCGYAPAERHNPARLDIHVPLALAVRRPDGSGKNNPSEVAYPRRRATAPSAQRGRHPDHAPVRRSNRRSLPELPGYLARFSNAWPRCREAERDRWLRCVQPRVWRSPPRSHVSCLAGPEGCGAVATLPPVPQALPAAPPDTGLSQGSEYRSWQPPYALEVEFCRLRTAS